jgi:hypothetical protein
MSKKGAAKTLQKFNVDENFCYAIIPSTLKPGEAHQPDILEAQA